MITLIDDGRAARIEETARVFLKNIQRNLFCAGVLEEALRYVMRHQQDRRYTAWGLFI